LFKIGDLFKVKKEFVSNKHVLYKMGDVFVVSKIKDYGERGFLIGVEESTAILMYKQKDGSYYSDFIEPIKDPQLEFQF